MADAAQTYDVIIIGGGPGGYNAAIRAGQLGLSVACVESRETLGGTCLNVGCMPSKALLHASEFYDAANGEFAKIGIEVTPKLNLGQMHAAKDESVTALTKWIEFLFKKNKADWIKGKGRIVGKGQVEVTAADGAKTVYACKDIVIATGSEPTPLPGVAFEAGKVIDSTGALALPKVPEHLIVVGAGVIGLELGSVWRRLGAKVTVVEFLDAVACIELIAGKPGHVDYNLVPSVIYTSPEVAWVGKTEAQLKEAGIPFKKGKFPFTANSRAKINHETEGFAKVLAHAETDRVLGVHVFGPQAGELIGEACVLMAFGGASEDLARICHPHPTRSEAVRQAAMGVEGWTMQA